jgi:hypothetical protein
MPPGLAASRFRCTKRIGPPRSGVPPTMQIQRGRVRIHGASITQHPGLPPTARVSENWPASAHRPYFGAVSGRTLDCANNCMDVQYLEQCFPGRRGCILSRQIEADHQGETIVKRVGCGLLFLVCTSSAFAGERYIEIWNPPEARGGLHRGTGAPNSPKRRQHVPHLVKTRAHRVPAVVTKTDAKQPSSGEATRTFAPDVFSIPRQITPEGNILRVDARNAPVEVSR